MADIGQHHVAQHGCVEFRPRDPRLSTKEISMSSVKFLYQRKSVLSALMLGSALMAGTAGASTMTATVSQILLLGGGVNLVYVYPAGGITGSPSCAAGSAYYSFSYTGTMGSAYLAALLAAQASGASVTLYGSSACTDQSISETLSYFSITANSGG